MVFLGDTDNRGTFYIATCAIFLAYILHPVVESAYHRIRAYSAWRTIENNERVDVTPYPLVSELLDWRGKCEAARIVTLILLLFSGASWGLDLHLGLVNIKDKPVKLFNCPTPVSLSNDTSGTYVWEVLKVLDERNETGKLENFVSTADDDREALSNGIARAVFSTDDYGEPALTGETTMAEWSTSVDNETTSLYYDAEGSTSTLTSLNCTGGGEERKLHIQGNDVSWGKVTTCETGPSMDGRDTDPPPTIILTNATATYFIVEEESSYPNFLYSVWTVTNESDKTISHLFYVGSSFRMVEAIITGIANNISTGGGCVDLMIEYSMEDENYIKSENRARPFGEQPACKRVMQNLDTIEPLERGIEADKIAIICIVLIATMSAVGIGWSKLLESRVGIDVFNRDELIKALLLGGEVELNKSSFAIRMFVSKVDGRICVEIFDTEGTEISCRGLLRRSLKVPHDGAAVAGRTPGNGTNDMPPRMRQGKLEVIRLAHGRDDFARRFPPLSLSVTPSPVSPPPPIPLSVSSSPAVSSSTNEAMPVSPANDRELDRSEVLATGRRFLCAPSSFNSIVDTPHHPWGTYR